MNEDLEQRDLPMHVFTHDRLLRMIERNKKRLGASSNYIIQNYNRFFHTSLTPNEFLNSISQKTVDELENMQLDPSMENERQRLLVEIDRYRKIRAIIRELKAMLMIMKYNRLTKEKRRELNTRHLAETGITFIEDIDRTMPVYPFYFRGLRTIIPKDDTEKITFDAVAYDNFRLIGGNVITLGGVLPETLINPVLVETRRNPVVFEVEKTGGLYHGHERDTADVFYDLDDERKTGKEREQSIEEANKIRKFIEEARKKADDLKKDKQEIKEGHRSEQDVVDHRRTITQSDDKQTQEEAEKRRKEAEWKMNAIGMFVDIIMKYKDENYLFDEAAIEIRQTLPGIDKYIQEDYGTLLDVLGNKKIDKDEFIETVEKLRGLLDKYDKQENATTARELVTNVLLHDYRTLEDGDIEEVSKLLRDYDKMVLSNYEALQEELAQHPENSIVEIVERLRKLYDAYIKEHEVTEDDIITENGVIKGGAKEEADERTRQIEEMQKVEKDADVESIKKVVDLGRYILKIRYKENPNTVDEIEGLLDEYDTLRLSADTAELVRTMNSIDPRIPAKVDKLRSKVMDLDRRGLIPDTRNNVEKLKDMINKFPDPSMVIFNHDITAFKEMAKIMELYHTIKADPRFGEKPIMKVSDEGKLTRTELEKLKKILQVYKEIYSNPSLRDAFTTHRTEQGKTR